MIMPDRRKQAFYALLALFGLWVGFLGYLAASSSEKPQAGVAAGGELRSE